MQSTRLRLRFNLALPRLGKNDSGFVNAFIAVILFSLTVPMTKLALTVFPAEIIALGRCLVAGICSLILILSLGWPLPNKKQWLGLMIGGAAVSLIFPYFLSLALGQWSAANMGVVLAAVPLMTALIASIVFKERHPTMFWLSVLVGTAILMDFTWGESQGGFHYSVIVMLLAAGIGYGAGGHVAKTLGGWQTICWMTVLYLPVSLGGLSFYLTQGQAITLNVTLSAESLIGIGAMLYLAFISQWLGFHFWYDAMAKVGIGKAGQVQLLQPFFTLLFSVPLLGLVLELNHFIYALLISFTVMVAVRFK